jgi:hypothetical protein
LHHYKQAQIKARRIKSADDGEPICALEVGADVESLAVVVGPAPLLGVLVGLLVRAPDVKAVEGLEDEGTTLKIAEKRDASQEKTYSAWLGVEAANGANPICNLPTSCTT